MKKPEIPVTSAVRFLRQHKIQFEPHFYTYEEHGGTGVAAKALGVPGQMVIKTLVFETEDKKPLIVLMHGDREVSTKNLARFLGVKSVAPCEARRAENATGYIFGGMSPFGTRTPLPVYVEKSIFNLQKIFINGGKRGFLIEITPNDLSPLNPTEVEISISHL